MELVLGRHTLHLALDRESMLTLLLCVVWSLTLVGYSRGIIVRLPILGDYADLTISAYYIVPLLLSLPLIVQRLCLADYLVYFVCAFYYGWNYVAFPENAPYLTEGAFRCLICTVPFYFIGRLIDIERRFNMFTLLSAACILMDLFYFLVYAQAHKNMAEVASDDNMHRAYISLPHVMMLLWSTLSRFRVWKAVLTFLGVMFLLSCGTRGPLFCLGVFGFVYFLFFMNFRGAFYVKVSILGLAGVVLLYLREIVQFLAQTFLGLNLSTRILDKVIAGDLGNDTYRGAIRDIFYHVLSEGSHFWGLGLSGCRNYGISYPHFLPLDFFCTFGYATGGVLLAVLFAFVVVAFCVARNTLVRTFILVLFTLGVVKLFLSSTFIFEPFFFMFLGVCATEVLNHAKNPTPQTT